MPTADDFADLGGGVFRWEAYDAASKVELSASAVVTAVGLYLIDPIALRAAALLELLETAEAPPAGILLTNVNHERASAAWSKTLDVPVLLDAGPAHNLQTIPLPGAAPGERAFYRSGGGGLMVIGDALINLPSHPFSMLPDKYCDDPAELRRSLAILLEHSFDRMLFAHGEPLMSGARARLGQLLKV